MPSRAAKPKKPLKHRGVSKLTLARMKSDHETVRSQRNELLDMVREYQGFVREQREATDRTREWNRELRQDLSESEEMVIELLKHITIMVKDLESLESREFEPHLAAFRAYAQTCLDKRRARKDACTA